MLHERNLTPWPKGVSGNPKGRPRGSKNLSTVLRELENEDFDWSKIPIKQKEAAKAIGSPWRAIMYTALAKAYSGDIKAMNWLSKVAYGEKIKHEFDEGFFDRNKLTIEIIKPNNGTGNE